MTYRKRKSVWRAPHSLFIAVLWTSFVLGGWVSGCGRHETVTQIHLRADTSTIVVGQTLPVRVYATVGDRIEERTDSCQFHSSDPKVATVSSDGEVTALRPGRVEITARLGDLRTPPFELRVEAIPQPNEADGRYP